jgi:type II secretory pathway component PulF
MIEPPPIPRRSPQASSPLPAPVSYTVTEPWSAVPLTVAACTWSVLISLFCLLVAPKFKQIFADFKVDLPAMTQWALGLGDLMARSYLWVVLVLASILVPALVVPSIDPPNDPEVRAAIVRRTRWCVLLIFLFTIILIVVAYFAPMITLMRSVSGPQKN